MKFRCHVTLLSILLAAPLADAGEAPARPPEVARYIKVEAPKVVLVHVRVIDGTGRPAVDDRNIEIADGRITRIEAGHDVKPAPGTTVLDLAGHTVIPGIVGMHNHLYYIATPNLVPGQTPSWEEPLLLPQTLFTSARLYLAGGVTTMRTTGSIEPYADLNLREEIEAGRLVGPHIDVTAPYIEGANSPFIQMHRLRDAAEATAFVDYWASVGATSFKAYMNVTRAQLKAAIDAAHRHGFKLTGHLCSVTYAEAAELGIDDLEHGFWVNTAGAPGKVADQCPEQDNATVIAMDPAGAEAGALIDTLIRHQVAVTSTLPVLEGYAVAGRPALSARFLEALTAEARTDYLYRRNARYAHPLPEGPTLLAHAMAMEKRFFDAGGLLLAGPDPTGNGGVLPGFGDQREIELLVEAGFTPENAIRVATLNGAVYEGRERDIGSIAVGKHADLVVIKGNPARAISDIEQVEIVFKDGIGYDSPALIRSVAGRYGQY